MTTKSIHQRFSALIILAFISTYLLTSAYAQAQQISSAKNKSPFPVKYRSLADQNILLRTITLAPVYDNLNGIYALPIQKLLIDLLQSDKSWGYAEISGHDQTKFIENYDLNPNDVIEVLAKTRAQGLITAFITKGPRGLNAKLKLFTHDQGLLLAEESIEDFDAFEVSKLRSQFSQMYQNLKNKLPYRGYVLSRRGSDVTVSLGTMNGVKEGQELTLAQIIKINRHPKLKTLVGVEKEIIAKIYVKKADPYLSFAEITFEKESGVVDMGAKVLPTEFITFPAAQLNSDGTVIGESPTLTDRVQIKPESIKKNSKLEFVHNTPTEDASNEHRETLFDRHNSLGSVTVQGLITQYAESNSLSGGLDSSSKQSFAPGFSLGAKIYFFDEIYAEFGLQSSSFSVDNGLSGSTPYSLGVNLSKLTTALGYDYIFERENSDDDDIKFTGVLGLTTFTSSIDNSNPVALTSTKVTALNLALKASLPVSDSLPLTLGGRFDLFFSPSLTESPVSSGNSSTTITSFGFFGTYKMSDKYNLVGELNVTSINNHFSGTATRANPAGASKLEFTTEQFGIEYLF